MQLHRRAAQRVARGVSFHSGTVPLAGVAHGQGAMAWDRGEKEKGYNTTAQKRASQPKARWTGTSMLDVRGVVRSFSGQGTSKRREVDAVTLADRRASDSPGRESDYRLWGVDDLEHPYADSREPLMDTSFEERTFRSMSKSQGATRLEHSPRLHDRGRVSVRRIVVHYARMLWQNPWRCLCALLVFTVFGTLLGLQIKYILDPDKERMPWRAECAEQPMFANKDIEHLAPVDLMVGVMSFDSSFERRHVIRNTYATMTAPRDKHTGRVLGNVQVKFVLGRPRKRYAHHVAMEMEMYNDIVILDVDETGSSHKTHKFFQWAAENATVPVLVPRNQGRLDGAPALEDKYDVHWKHVDYVLKADDDAFIVLDELERRLRAVPRHMVYWGCTYDILIQIWYAASSWPARRMRCRTT